MFHCPYSAITITIHNSAADSEKDIFYRDEKEPQSFNLFSLNA